MTTLHRVNFVLGLGLIASLGLALYKDPALERRGKVVQLPAVGGVDRCPTCHTFAIEEKPQKPHPKIAGHDDLTAFGCTPCHGGQGRRLDREAHLPRLGGGPNPFLDRRHREARCARCHVPTGLAGAAALDRGFTEYLKAGCTGCHLPGRADEGLGPDLRRLGRRTRAELLETLLDPRKKHGQALMWSLRPWYDETTKEGKKKLADLVTALLAIADSPEPYRQHWARPALQIDVRCDSCHDTEGAKEPRGARHRCTLLRQRESLACRRCHSEGTGKDKATAPRPLVQVRDRECPQIRAVRPLCPVCHLRGFHRRTAPARTR